jgi:polyhydroxybutyrate depolymerase
VINGGHDWPGISGNMDINASEEIWKFVSQYDINGLINCGNTTISEKNKPEFELFPNPSSKFIKLKNIQENNMNYAIYNSFGKLIIIGTLNSPNYNIDISKLESQIYILKVGEFSYKIIKE